MAQISSESQDAAVKALALELDDEGGFALNATEIWRRLLAGTAGLPQPMEHAKLRTVQEKVQRFRREYRPESDPLQNAEPIDAADAQLRSLLRSTNTVCERIDKRVASGRETARDLELGARTVKLIVEIKKALSGQAAAGRPDPDKVSRKQKAGEANGRTVSPASVLDRLAEEEKAARSEQVRPASDEAPAKGSDGEREDNASTLDAAGEAQALEGGEDGGERVSVESARLSAPAAAASTAAGTGG